LLRGTVLWTLARVWTVAVTKTRNFGERDQT
jgi:hypothetical protein